MVRRATRNYLAVHLPAYYRRRLSAIEQNLPKIGEASIAVAGLGEVVEFYGAEYRTRIDALCSGRVHLYGREINFGHPEKINWGHYVSEEGDHQMWRVKLAHMGFLAPMLADCRAEHHIAAAQIITGFRQQTNVTDPGSFSAYWFPYAVSHRLLAIGSGFLVARSRGEINPELAALVADFLRENAAFLIDNIEYELCNNHVERNLAALCLYFSHVNRAPIEIAERLERDIAYLVERTILTDGVQVERSPMYQGLSVLSLAVMTEAPFLSQSLRKKLSDKLAAARRAFSLLCHPDGQVALFNDSWHEEVPRLMGTPKLNGRFLLKNGGYARLSHDADLCLLDAGALGPRWNPAHGHADFLAVEITLNSHRLIVDPGTSRYNSGPERAQERSAEAHNGPVWVGHEPVEFFDCFKIGRIAEAGLLREERLSSDLTIGGTFSSRPGLVARLVRHYPGAGFLVADMWESTKHQGQVTCLVAGTWMIESVKESQINLRLIENGAHAVIDILSAAGADAPYLSQSATHYGRHDPAWKLRMHPQSMNGRQHLLCWIGHKASTAQVVTDSKGLLHQLEAIVNCHGAR